jgi:hypothetical protein
MTDTTIDTIAHRCGAATKSGSACRTPVVRAGGRCGNHRQAKAVHTNSAHGNKPGAETTTENLVTAFVANYRCLSCDADVRLLADGPAQLILIGHAAACPQLVERVQRRSA